MLTTKNWFLFSSVVGGLVRVEAEGRLKRSASFSLLDYTLPPVLSEMPGLDQVNPILSTSAWVQGKMMKTEIFINFFRKMWWKIMGGMFKRENSFLQSRNRQDKKDRHKQVRYTSRENVVWSASPKCVSGRTWYNSFKWDLFFWHFYIYKS